MRFVVAILISLSLIILPSNLILGSLSGQYENGVKKKVLWADVKDLYLLQHQKILQLL